MLITLRYIKPETLGIFTRLFNTIEYYMYQLWIDIRRPFVMNLPYFLPRR